MTSIVTNDAPVLRQIAKELPTSEIQDTKVQKIIKTMQEALAKEKHGVALAAPQIGQSLRIFVVAGFVFARRAGEEYDEKVHKPKVYINPTITNASKRSVVGDEGCLSIPNKYSWSVKRAEKISIDYLDEKGKKHSRGASGFLARIFQHEIDHLDGKLYTDIAKSIEKVDENFKKID